MLLHGRVEEQGTVKLHVKVITPFFPKIYHDPAFMRERLLNKQGTFGQERVIDTGEFGGGDGKEVITHPVRAASAPTLGAGEMAAKVDTVTDVVNVPNAAEWVGRGGLGVPVGKSLDRADFSCPNVSKVTEDDTCDVVR